MRWAHEGVFDKMYDVGWIWQKTTGKEVTVTCNRSKALTSVNRGRSR